MIIYEDENTTVEIDDFFNYFIDFIYVRTLKLPTFNLKILIKIATKEIEQELNLKKEPLLVSSNIPVVKDNTVLSIIEQFNSFNDAFKMLSFVTKETTEDILNLIREDYNEKEFLIKIFDKPAMKVDGYMAIKEDGKLKIMFFILDALKD